MSDNLLYDVVHMLAYRDCFIEADGYSSTVRLIRSDLSKWLKDHPYFMDAFDCDKKDGSLNDMNSEKNRRFFKILKDQGHPFVRTIDGDLCIDGIVSRYALMGD